jgi:hypothetical protein
VERRRCTKFFHQRGRNKPNDEENSQRYDQQIIEISQNWNEVRNQIDRAQRVGRDHDGKQFCVPGDARVARRDRDGENVAPDRSSPAA